MTRNNIRQNRLNKLIFFTLIFFIGCNNSDVNSTDFVLFKTEVKNYKKRNFFTRSPTLFYHLAVQNETDNILVFECVENISALDGEEVLFRNLHEYSIKYLKKGERDTIVVSHEILDSNLNDKKIDLYLKSTLKFQIDTSCTNYINSIPKLEREKLTNKIVLIKNIKVIRGENFTSIIE